MGPCVVCGTALGRYKCPGCVVRYCSVPCYAAHKASCVPAPVAATRAAVPLLTRASRKRPYEQEREEVTYTASLEVLERVLETPKAAAVVAILRQRHRSREAEEREAEEKPQEGADGESESGEAPEQLTTAKMKGPVQKSAAVVSAEAADRASRMEQMADVVARVMNLPSLQQRRDLLMLLMEQSSECDNFCDVVLRALGARDEQGRFVLQVSKEPKAIQ